MLRRLGLDPDHEVQPVVMTPGGYSRHVRMLAEGALDAAFVGSALIPSLTQAQALRHYERYVAPYFTADGRHDPGVCAQAVSSVAQELGVSTVPDAADIYRTEPAERSAA